MCSFAFVLLVAVVSSSLPSVRVCLFVKQSKTCAISFLFLLLFLLFSFFFKICKYMYMCVCIRKWERLVCCVDIIPCRFFIYIQREREIFVYWIDEHAFKWECECVQQVKNKKQQQLICQNAEGKATGHATRVVATAVLSLLTNEMLCYQRASTLVSSSKSSIMFEIYIHIRCFYIYKHMQITFGCCVQRECSSQRANCRHLCLLFLFFCTLVSVGCCCWMLVVFELEFATHFWMCCVLTPK